MRPYSIKLSPCCLKGLKMKNQSFFILTLFQLPKSCDLLSSIKHKSPKDSNLSMQLHCQCLCNYNEWYSYGFQASKGCKSTIKV